MEEVIVGIDEVGRGSLAGPVVVCVVALPKKLRIRKKELGRLKDSKRLSVNQRKKWFKFFKDHSGVEYILAKVYPRRIEKINISRAANLAALNAYKRLADTIPALSRKNSKPEVFLDGGLYLGNGKNRLSAKTVVHGDQKIPAVMIASIIAKVKRDDFMKKLALKYPAYGFEIHKGYGTRGHYAAIKKFGPSEVHRRTFVKFP